MRLRWISVAVLALVMLGSGCGRNSARDASDVNRCKGDHLSACQSAAKTHQQRGGAPQDDAEVVDDYERACEQGQARGCYDLGMMYQNGQGVLKSEVKAFIMFQKACTMHEPNGCFLVGNHYRHGGAVQQNLDKAAGFFHEACAGNVMAACGELGAIHLSPVVCLSTSYANSWASCELARGYLELPGTKIDVAKGVALVEKACAGGYADACNILATGYEYGIVGLDSDRAREMVACDLVSLGACSGVLPDRASAIRFNQKACDLGSRSGCHDVAQMYLFSRNAKEHELAIELLRKGCTAQFGPSCGVLGEAYLEGRRVPKDISQAAIYLEKACDLDVLSVCSKVAKFYDYGTGVTRDIDKATRLYKKSCTPRFQVSCIMLSDPQFRPSGVP